MFKLSSFYLDNYVGGGSFIFKYYFQGALGIGIALVEGKKDGTSLKMWFYGLSLEETHTTSAHISLARS